MNHADRLRAFSELYLLLTTLRKSNTMTTLANEMAGSRNGYPTGHSGAGGDSDPMLERAMGPDVAARDLRNLDDMLADMLGKARAMDDLRRRYLVPAVVASKAMQRKSDEGCCVVAQVGSWEPVAHVTTDEGTITVDGAEVSLCEEGKGRRLSLGSWAYDFARQHRRLPFDYEAELHVRGKRVRVKAS